MTYYIRQDGRTGSGSIVGIREDNVVTEDLPRRRDTTGSKMEWGLLATVQRCAYVGCGFVGHVASRTILRITRKQSWRGDFPSLEYLHVVDEGEPQLPRDVQGFEHDDLSNKQQAVTAITSRGVAPLRLVHSGEACTIY